MLNIYCRVTDLGLIPMYDSDYDDKRRLKVGDTVLCSISRPRNYEFHKKFFALLRIAFENLPEHLVQMMNIRNEDDMLTCIKLDLNLFTTVWHGGRQVIKPGSISFASMDNTEFERFYNSAMDVILHTYLRGTEKQALLDEVSNFK